MTLFSTERRYGVEIECQLPTDPGWYRLAEQLVRAGIDCFVESYNHTTRDYWKIVHDSSIRDVFVDLAGAIYTEYDEDEEPEANCEYCDTEEYVPRCDRDMGCPGTEHGAPDPDYVLSWYDEEDDHNWENVQEWDCEYCHENWDELQHPCDWGDDCPESAYSHDRRPPREQIATGNELVSPPLLGLPGIADIQHICWHLRAAQASTDDSCGLHVHHSAEGFGIDAWKNLIKLYAVNQEAFNLLIKDPRKHNSYCSSITSPWSVDRRTYRPAPVDLERMFYDIDQCATLERLNRIIPGRAAINLSAFAAYGTVEFRQHHGTIDADEITNWVGLTQGLMETARNAVFPPKIDSQLTLFPDTWEEQLRALMGTMPGTHIMGDFYRRKVRQLEHDVLPAAYGRFPIVAQPADGPTSEPQPEPEFVLQAEPAPHLVNADPPWSSDGRYCENCGNWPLCGTALAVQTSGLTHTLCIEPRNHDAWVPVEVTQVIPPPIVTFSPDSDTFSPASTTETTTISSSNYIVIDDVSST